MSGAPTFAVRGSAVSTLRDRRAWWLGALEVATEAAQVIADGGELAGHIAFDLTGVTVRAGQVAFPLPMASAALAAAGFREQLRALVTSQDRAVRAALAPAVIAGATACRRLLELETEQQAAAHRRRYGEG